VIDRNLSSTVLQLIERQQVLVSDFHVHVCFPGLTKAVGSNWVHLMKENVFPASRVTRICHIELHSFPMRRCFRLQIYSYRMFLEYDATSDGKGK
jgi:hypothetical protein